MTHIFLSLVLSSIAGTFLALILILLRPVTRKLFSGSWHYYMWLVVLLVMILPLRLDIPDISEAENNITETVIITDSHTNVENIHILPEIEKNIAEEIPEPEKAPATKNIKNYLESNITLFSFIWILGVILLFIIKAFGYHLFIIKMHKCSEVESYPEISAYTKRKINVRVSDTICSPLLMGILRPTLILPKTDITCNQLHNILMHEMTHLKRNDILYKWFVNLVKCIHWFNPAIWIIKKQINTDCEISCDLEVVKNMDKEAEKNYIETILSLLSYKNSRTVPLTTGMAGNKKILKKRFLMIKDKIKVNKKVTIISIISAIIILTAALFTSGLLNGTLLKSFDNTNTSLNTDIAENGNFNLLFIGIDNNEKSDTIMLISFNESGIKCLSIPRNTVFEGKTISDIKSEENGEQKAVDIIKKTLSTPIHYYAEMNLSAIKKIVDSLGGIDFDVPMDMVYSDPYQNLDINLKKGVHTLNGDGVCQLLQYRKNYPEGDIGRIKLHQQFLKNLINQKFKKENINKVPKILKAVSDDIKTNYPIKNIINDLKRISTGTIKNITFEILPGKNTVSDEISVYKSDIPEKADKLITFVWPTESKKITNTFGKRVHPITGEEKIHNGIDIASPEGSQVISATEGEVIDTGFDEKYGNYIIITNDNGVTVYYGHLSDVEVLKGNKVNQKDIIGKVGKTGTATGACLHLEIKIDGKYYNPEELLFSKNETESETVTSTQTPQKNDYKIKATTKSDNSDIVLSHLTLKEKTDIKMLEQILNQSGITISKNNYIDLSKNYLLGKCESGDNIKTYCDNNGNITLYFNNNENDYIDIIFTDIKSGNVVAEYGVMPDTQKSYSFMGFEKNKEYGIQFQEHIKNDINYIIY